MVGILSLYDFYMILNVLIVFGISLVVVILVGFFIKQHIKDRKESVKIK